MTAPLRTERLLLRVPTLADVPAYHRHFVDYEVVRYLARQIPWPYPDDGVLRFLADRLLPSLGPDRWAWGLFLREAPGELIGLVELWRHGVPEHRGFWLGRAFWGRGLMTEATTAITDHAFDELGFETLLLSNAVGNERSRRVKERAGATLVGRVRAEFVDPDVGEKEIWAITREAWDARRRSQD